ncbi:MAG: hypothetical protein AAFU03_17795, partial [Bacteroidota bacterium]
MAVSLGCTAHLTGQVLPCDVVGCSDQVFDWSAMEWNSNSGWTNNDLNPQTIVNFDGSGTSATFTMSGLPPNPSSAATVAGPNVYGADNEENCQSSLRIQSNAAAMSLADLPTGNINYSQPITANQFIVGPVRTGLLHVLTFSNNGTPIDPSTFTVTGFEPGGGAVSARITSDVASNTLYIHANFVAGAVNGGYAVINLGATGTELTDISWSVGAESGSDPSNFVISGTSTSYWISPICYTGDAPDCTETLSITAAATCEDGSGNQAGENAYFIEVTDVSGGPGGPYDVSIGDDTLSFSGTPITFGPYAHSGVGGAVQVIVADDPTDLVCGIRGTLEVPEILCGLTTANGLNASGPFSIPTTDPTVNTGAILIQ